MSTDAKITAAYRKAVEQVRENPTLTPAQREELVRELKVGLKMAREDRKKRGPGYWAGMFGSFAKWAIAGGH